MPAWAVGVAGLALLPLAVKTAELAATQLGSHDPSVVVIDEVVGQWIALSAAASGSWPQWVAALVLFRVFDITKPLGIRRLEALPGGRGVVADDVGAGACAMIGVALVRWLGF
jgi:phosphatidylglycerophosphatase A